ncbi:MAG: polyprenyl synthetase family protein [Bacteroidales bacterium]|jgi:octaprenyl-diphosphate synthase|nr:polyprenyl synthetase family protein [Bacteroidales bacterium]NPV36004.1 polyprenyl synthetase family protein [Bacteroidales bacterium]
MSGSLDKIKAPVAEELKVFEELFRRSMKSQAPLLDLVLRFILKRKGKQIRPLFVFLTAKSTGQITPATHRAATLIELLHTATLVHDDVVDDANERRGFFSVNALWKNKIAVLSGDYLLARGLLLSVEHGDYDLLKIVSEATREMSEGELLQMEKARRLDISEEVYFEIIRKKTASLIASCCACGARSSGASEEIVSRMKRFGELVGLAFQIKDDLFDYEKTNLTGKPTGIDIRERKMTLPLIYVLNQCNAAEKRLIINTVKNDHDNLARVEQLIKMVIRYGGLDYAKKRMLELREEALGMLDELPDSDAVAALRNLVIFTTDREN